jgi:hypothetical protein
MRALLTPLLLSALLHTAPSHASASGAAEFAQAVEQPSTQEPAASEPAAGEEAVDPASGQSSGDPVAGAQGEAGAEILRDLSVLPFPARKMHELLVEAAKSGDIEKLRVFIGEGDDATLLSFGGYDGDPIDFLKSLSGDEEGREVLAILLEILQTGFVHVDKGTEHELYVWPYFAVLPLKSLTPEQKVELYTILTHGDLLEMEEFGAYIFFRTAITPQGRWRFFVAGD